MIILSVAWFFAKGTYYEPISPSEMLEKRPGLHEVKIKGSGSEGCRGLPSSSSFVAVAALGRRSDDMVEAERSDALRLQGDGFSRKKTRQTLPQSNACADKPVRLD